MMQLKPIPPPPDATGVTDDNGKPVKWFEVNGEPVWVSQSMTDAEVIAALTPKPQPIPAGAPVRDMLSPEQQSAYSQAQMQGPGIVDMLTGSSRRIPGIPEISDTAYYANPQASIGTTVQKFTQTDPEELARYYLQSIPGAQLVRDDSGRPMLAYPDPSTGQRRIEYVNAPGISPQDITSTVGLGALFSGAGKVPGKIMETGAAALARITGQQTASRAIPSAGGAITGGREAIGAGIVGTGVETAQSVTGGEFSPANVLVEAAAGGAAPKVAQAFGSAFKRATAAFTKPETVDPSAIRAEMMMAADEVGGEQGEAMRQAIAGMDDEFVRDIAKRSLVVNRPEDAGQIILAEAYRREIPGFQPLRAYLTGQREDYVMLDTARRRDVFGNQAEIQAIDEQNKAAIAERLRQLTPNFAQASDAFAAAGYGVKERANALWSAMGEAYDRAREKQGKFAAEGVGSLVGKLDEAIGSKGLDPTNYPASMAGLEQVQRFITQASDKLPKIAEDAPLTERYRGLNPMVDGRDVAEYVQLRRNLNALYSGAQGDDRIVVTDMVRALDSWADDMETAAFYSGDEGAIQAFRDANKLRREYGQQFGEKADRFRTGERKPDFAGRVMRDLAEREDLDGQAIGNLIIAGVNTGNMKQSASVLDRLGKVVGKNSPEWNAIQEGTMIRLFLKPDGTMREFGLIRRDVEKLLNGEHKDIGARVFTPEQQGTLNRLSMLLARLPTPKEAYSPSGNIAAAAIGEQITAITGNTPMVSGLGRAIGGAVTRGIDPRTNQVNVAPVYIPSADLRGKVSAALQVGGQQALGGYMGGSESNRQKTEGK